MTPQLLVERLLLFGKRQVPIVVAPLDRWLRTARVKRSDAVFSLTTQ